MSLDSNLQALATAVGTAVKGKISSSEKGVANGVATLDGTGKIPSAQLPSYVDDVVEYANLAAFPATGSTGILYIAIDTNKQYRWGGSAYAQITSGAVDSVAGKTGVITLVKGDVGLGNVDNTADASKSVSSAATLTTARTINGVSFNGGANINIEDRLGTAIASASTTTVGTAGLGDTIHITGTTGITNFGVSATGTRRTLIFDGILTITHNATSLICPGGVNIATNIGDIIEIVCENGVSGYWKIVSYVSGVISSVEMNYLDGVTSNIQTQLNNTATASSVSTLTTNIGATDTNLVNVFNAALV